MNDNPAGEVRPMIHRKPPNDTATWSTSLRSPVGQPHGRVQAVRRLPHAANRRIIGVREPANGESRLQMLGADRPVVGAEQPAFGEPEDEVDGRQAERGVAPGTGQTDRFVGVARGLEPAIARPAVGGDFGGAQDVPAEKANQAAGRGVAHRLQPQPAEPATARLAAPALDRAGHHRLARGAAAGLAGLGAADQGLVGLDPVAERLAARHDHGTTDLVQPRPSRPIAAEAHLPLELHGRDPALARGHQIDGEKPARQAGLGLLEDRAGEDRVLLAASRALLDQPLLVAVSLIVAAAAAVKARGPTRAHQIGPTRLIRAEALEKGRQIPRQVLEQSVSHRALI